MSLSLQVINLDEIDCRDLSFVASYGFDLTRLKASIQTLGLLSPPLLRRRPDERYQIVCGYQRVLVLEQLGWPKLPALLVPEETTAIWCLQASLHDNALGRGFNPIEAVLMIDRLLGYFNEDTVRRCFLPLLGLPPSVQQLQRARSLLNLEAPWHELVAQHRLSMEAAALVGQWEAAAREILLPWFQTLHLSSSKQIELLECLITLSRRAGNSPADWLQRPELLDLLVDPVLTKSEKSNRLWEALRQWYYPRASQTRQQFQDYLKAMRLYQHPEIRLTAAPAFEDAFFRLELHFQDKSQLARQLQHLREILEQPEFEALLHL